MTTFVDFVPSVISPFQFRATFDGSTYNVVIVWNLYGQRYFVNVYDLSQNLIFSIGLKNSPIGYDINILWGYFETSTLVYRTPNAQFEIGP
jgi:hypothetical protein